MYTVNKCGGQYVYFGLANALRYHLGDVDQIPTTLLIQINIDGLSLSKSSTETLWPILCRFSWSKPFEIALFHGMAKPDPVEDFLEDFIEEYQELKTAGIEISNQVIPLKIEFIVCDALARQFIKKIKSHSGYYACERCEAKGIRKDHYAIFDTTCSRPRQDDKFDTFQYSGMDNEGHEHHQLAQSPMANVVNCVSDFVLDYMHLVLLGVVKRLIEFWKRGSPNDIRCKFSENLRSQIDHRLTSFRNALPYEFARQPRTLKTSERWKATKY